jgi:hypothetical protein
MNHAVQLIGQHPALRYGNIFEISASGGHERNHEGKRAATEPEPCTLKTVLLCRARRLSIPGMPNLPTQYLPRKEGDRGVLSFLANHQASDSARVSARNKLAMPDPPSSRQRPAVCKMSRWRCGRLCRFPGCRRRADSRTRDPTIPGRERLPDPAACFLLLKGKTSGISSTYDRSGAFR